MSNPKQPMSDCQIAAEDWVGYLRATAKSLREAGDPPYVGLNASELDQAADEMDRLRMLEPHAYISEFCIGQAVYIDAPSDLPMVVTGVQFLAGGYQEVQVSWFYNGTSNSVWIDAFRVKPATP